MPQIGNKVLCHTHLGIWCGEISTMDKTHVELKSCSWVVDHGRMSESLTNGRLQETEYAGDGVEVPRTGTIFVPWNHALPGPRTAAR